MTLTLVDTNKRLVFEFSEINHKGLGPMVVQLDLR